MFITAIVLAAGKGSRLKSRISKPLVKLGAEPVLLYSLRAFAACRRVNSIIVAANEANIGAVKRAVALSGITKVSAVVLGGARRQDSVGNALKVLPDKCDYCLIHDAARPLIDAASVNRLISAVIRTKAAILGVPVKSTVKEAAISRSGSVIVKRTLDRGKLWEIQTPQAFSRGVLDKAYALFGAADATDDASLVEKLGVRISLVAGSYSNIKITTPGDVKIAGALLGMRR